MAKKSRKDPQMFMNPVDDASEQEASQPDASVIALPKSGPNSYKEWMSRVKKSQKVIEDLQSEWDANTRRYLNQKRSSQNDEELLVPTLFQNVEQKKSMLIAHNPFVVVTAKRPNAVQVAPLMEAVMNDVLGAAQPDGVDAMVMFEETMSDALCASGIFACHIGYEAFIDGTKEVQTGTQPDPMWVPPAPESLIPGQPLPQAPMVPVIETVPNVVFEKYYMDRLSPSKLLIPEDFKGIDYDRAAWLGFEFIMDFYLAKRKWKQIPDDYDSFVSDDDHLINARGNSRTTMSADKRKMVRGYMLYYKGAIFDNSVVHPYQQRCLVLIDGIKEAVYHKDSDFQWQNEDGTLGGMVGFPVHIGALRYVSDSAYPPSDASMSKYQDEEISDGRSMMKLQRKRNIPMRLANKDVLKETGLAKIEKGIWGAVIPLEGAAFVDGKVAIVDVQQGQFPSENFTFDNLSKRDNDATYGLGAAPNGALPQGTASTSAEQSGAAQASSNSRIGRERNKFTGWYARAVEKLSVLYQHFMTDTQYVHMIGPDGAKVLTEWNKDSIPGKFTFTILPNSSIDLTEQRNEEMAWYNLAIKSPNVNHQELDTNLVKAFGKDPAKMIVPPATPPPTLPKGVTLSLDKMLASPDSPDFVIAIEILRASGMKISDTAIAQAQQQAKKTGIGPTAVGHVVDGQIQQPPPQPMAPGAPQQPQHGGAAPKADVVDAHQFDRSGELPGPH